MGEVGDLITGMREEEELEGVSLRRLEEVSGEESSRRKFCSVVEGCFLLRFMLLLTGIEEDDGMDVLRTVGDERSGTASTFGLIGEGFCWMYCTCWRWGGGLVDDSSEDLFSSLSSSSSSLLKNRL